MGFKIDITGDVKKIFRERTRAITEKIEKEMDDFGQATVNDAKRLAPVDEGSLKQSITYRKIIARSAIEIEMIVASDYAAYIEFGTKGFAAKYVATLPKEWKEFAARYKGPGGGSFDEFVMRLTRWVRLKKIGATYNVSTRKKNKQSKASLESTAYAIALSIMRKGIRQHPFLYPAVEKNRIELLKRLKVLR